MKRPIRIYSETGEDKFYIKNKKGKKLYIETNLSKDKVQKEFIKIYISTKSAPIRKRKGTSYRTKPVTRNEQERPQIPSQIGTKDTIYMTDNEKEKNLINTLQENRKLYYLTQGIDINNSVEDSKLKLLEDRIVYRIQDTQFKDEKKNEDKFKDENKNEDEFKDEFKAEEPVKPVKKTKKYKSMFKSKSKSKEFLETEAIDFESITPKGMMRNIDITPKIPTLFVPENIMKLDEEANIERKFSKDLVKLNRFEDLKKTNKTFKAKITDFKQLTNRKNLSKQMKIDLIDDFNLTGTNQSRKLSEGLYESQIQEIMKQQEAVYCPVIARDEINDIKIVGNGEPTFFVMNLSKREDKDGGSHWVSVYMDNNDISYFDSFGIEPNVDVKNDLIKLANKDILNTLRKFKINRKKLQKNYQTDCGYRAIEFLDNMLEGKSFKEATSFTEKDMNKLKEKYPTEYV